MIALFPNEKKTQSFELAARIREFFEEKGIAVAAEDEKASKIGATPLSSVNPKDIDLLISMHLAPNCPPFFLPRRTHFRNQSWPPWIYGRYPSHGYLPQS